MSRWQHADLSSAVPTYLGVPNAERLRFNPSLRTADEAVALDAVDSESPADEARPITVLAKASSAPGTTTMLSTRVSPMKRSA